MLYSPRRRPTKMSETTATILQLAEIKPKRIDELFDQRAADRRLLMLSTASYHVKKIRRHTGIPVTLIYRQNLTILIEIEWGTKKISWIHKYEEESQNRCKLHIYRAIPQSVAVTAAGKKFGDIVQGFDIFDSKVVTAIEANGGSSSIHLRQSWIPIV